MLILIAFLCKEGYDELNTKFKELNKKIKSIRKIKSIEYMPT